MPVELSIVETVTELETTVVEVVLDSSSAPGIPGPGVPTGGTANQVLTKDSGTDYDTSWQDAQGGGGGAPDDVDYLVGTASGDLSAEIVVGTSPGGELGGTWASPTVDATHSGSSHASVQAAAEATAASELATHAADTTSVHGIADTSALALTANHPGNATFNDHSTRHENGGADEISIAGLDGTSTELAAHLADTVDAHDASAISIADAGNDFTATDVEGALAELQSDHEADATALSDHIADATAAHAATAISFTPDGSIAATTVQAAIVEVRDEASGGGVPTSRNLTAGDGLAGGGDLTADRTFSVNVDGSTLEINSDTLRVKAAGILASHIGDAELAALAGLTSAANKIIRFTGSGTAELLDFTDWASYTPALTAVTTDPTLGSGSSSLGRWMRIGGLVVFVAHITFGTSGTNAGSGAYRVSLPVTVGANQLAVSGFGVTIDASASDAFSVTVRPSPGDAFATMGLAQTTTVSSVGAASPFAWTVSDQIAIFGVCEPA